MNESFNNISEIYTECHNALDSKDTIKIVNFKVILYV